MKDRALTIILVVIIGVILGVGIVSKKAADPVMQHMVKQQEEILQVQKKIDQKLASDDDDKDNGNDYDFSDRLGEIENRLQSLEGQVKFMMAVGAMPGKGAAARPMAPPQEDLSKVYEIPVDDSYIQGKKDAPISIVEFVDFQCPFCARFYPPVAETLKAYPNDVNYIIKNFPLSFHPQAKPAAKAALAAGE